MHFQLYAWRFVFTALDRVFFPPGKAVNTIRGAFGSLAASEIFSPVSESGPSGLRTRPQPFVFRAVHLDGARFDEGATFHFDLHYFDSRTDAHDTVTAALSRLGSIGPTRGKVRLNRILPLADPPLVIPLDPCSTPANTAELTFVTPTELKSEGRVADEPTFPVLFARVRDRVAALSAFYGAGALDGAVLQDLSRRAASVRLTRKDIQHVTGERRSSRTGQTHFIGGFTGAAVYEGDLTDFVPWLLCAEWTGVGRHTGFGNGVIRIDKIT